MLSFIKRNITGIGGFFAVSIVICSMPLFFSTGCNFDPTESSTLSDTVTYKISGTVTRANDGSGLKGIKVWMFDSSSSYKSLSDITDTAGNYNLSWPYKRTYFLQILFLNTNTDKDSIYHSDTVDLEFDKDYFKYRFDKYQDIELGN